MTRLPRTRSRLRPSHRGLARSRSRRRPRPGPRDGPGGISLDPTAASHAPAAEVPDQESFRVPRRRGDGRDRCNRGRGRWAPELTTTFGGPVGPGHRLDRAVGFANRRIPRTISHARTHCQTFGIGNVDRHREHGRDSIGESATLLPNGKVLVAGGNPQFNRRGLTRATAELYDPSTGRWTLTGSMHEAREGHAAVLLANGKVLVLGGGASSGGVSRLVSSAELYDPSTGTWTDTGRLTTARAGATATVLSDGRVLVTGGASSRTGDPERSAEVYDPITGIWAKTAAMSVPRNGHTATLLPDGRVLVVGGQCCTEPAVASAELYDPASGTWTETGVLASARRNHTAVLLGDGNVLVYGGDNGNSLSPAVTTAELYDPVTGVWVATGSPGSAGNFFEAQGGGQAKPLPDGKVLAATYGRGRAVRPFQRFMDQGRRPERRSLHLRSHVHVAGRRPGPRNV